MDSIDIQTSILGLFRIAFFAIALVHGVRVKRLAQSVGFGFALIGSLIFLLSNSGFGVSDWLFNVAIVTATPAAAFIAAAAMWGSSSKNERWEWL